MVKKKQPYDIECECGMKIRGFSEHHAKQNLKIHKQTSQKHKELLELKKKWLKEK
tara:strand:+ start:817 stop:981 length:165 start_codon:yes stop_codon:yes gene_type:complete